MASYHFSAQILKRSEGRSAVAAAAYRSGKKLARAETGDEHDYTRKHGVVSAEILAPEDAPEWALDRAELWNRVEAKEKRKNSQLAREFKVALPHELGAEEQRQLVVSWAERELVARGMVVDLFIHDPEPGEHGNRNTHAHGMVTMRELDESQPDGWAKTRNRAWNDVELLEELRESWAEAQNAALERAGVEERVDHRSLEDQRAAAIEAGDDLLAAALDRPPEPRLGVAAGAIEKKAKASAELAGRAYEPVTERGRDLAQARRVRAVLLEGLQEARAAALSAVKKIEQVGGFLAAAIRDEFIGQAKRPDDPFESEPEPETGSDEEPSLGL